MILLLLMAYGCASPQPKAEVWDLYDIHHSPPEDPQAAASQPQENQQFIDDDIYYTAPGTYQLDPD